MIANQVGNSDCWGPPYPNDSQFRNLTSNRIFALNIFGIIVRYKCIKLLHCIVDYFNNASSAQRKLLVLEILFVWLLKC